VNFDIGNIIDLAAFIITVVVFFIRSEGRLSKVEGRTESLEKKTDELDGKVDAVETLRSEIAKISANLEWIAEYVKRQMAKEDK
jgi:hypothetical protein